MVTVVALLPGMDEGGAKKVKGPTCAPEADLQNINGCALPGYSHSRVGCDPWTSF